MFRGLLQPCNLVLFVASMNPVHRCEQHVNFYCWQLLAVQFLQVWFNLKETYAFIMCYRSFLGGMQSNCNLKLVFLRMKYILLLLVLDASLSISTSASEEVF